MQNLIEALHDELEELSEIVNPDPSVLSRIQEIEEAIQNSDKED